MPLADKWNQFTANPKSQKAGEYFKKAETGIWRALGPIGKGANRLAGRVGAEAFWPTELAEGEIEKAARILRTFTLDGVQEEVKVVEQQDVNNDTSTMAATAPQSKTPTTTSTTATTTTNAKVDKNASRKTQKVIKKISQSALQDCCGIAIFTSFRFGMALSGAGGSGVVMSKLPDGSWSPPSGILIHTISYGFLIGIDVYDVVLIIRKPEALKAFEHPKFSIGGEFSIAAGPIGNGAILDSGMEAAPCWSYTKSKGVYAGIQLDGNIILKREDANARFYGSKATTADILSGKIVPTKSAINSLEPLWQTLYAAEGRKDVKTEFIPKGLAPGEMTLSSEEAKELEALNHQENNDSNVNTSIAPSNSSSTKRFVPPPFQEASKSQPETSTIVQENNLSTSLVDTSIPQEVIPQDTTTLQQSTQEASTNSLPPPPSYSEKS